MDDKFAASWMTETTVNPLGLTVLILLSIAVLVGNRRHAVMAFIVMGCFIPQGQNIRALGLSFYLMRTLGLVALLRICVRREIGDVRFNRIDATALAWTIIGTAVFTTQLGMRGLTMKLGWLCEGALLYFIFRALIRDRQDVRIIGTTFAVISVPVVLCFLIEHQTGRNLFAAFGGVPAQSEVREGRVRCQGAFAHSILAGCFWAAVIPMFAASFWHSGTYKMWGIVGTVCSLLMIALCASSTPVVGVLAGLIGMALYRARYHFTMIRWAIVALLIGLHLIMKAPVWALLQRVDIIGGSTGYHRYQLVDGAIRNFDSWWLLGTQSTESWGHGLTDVTNQYILEGVRGGLLTMVLFIAMIAFAFGRIGHLWRSAPTQSVRMTYWALGAALAVHCVNFIGVAYFGQITMLFSLQLAMVASQPISAPVRKRAQIATAATRPIAPAAVPA